MNLENLKNKDIAYLVGVFQSDGYFSIFRDEKRKKTQKRFGIDGKTKSLPMIKKFREIFNYYFNRNVSIQKDKNKNRFSFRTSINRLLTEFTQLEILPKNISPPQWIQNIELFGAYIAGLIDGDGNICIKRPKYPQCRIRITNERKQKELAFFIQKIFNCSTTLTPVKKDSVLNGRKIHGEAYDLEFYVSKKNIYYIKKFVYPYIQIKHKRKTLEKFFKIKNIDN